MSKVNEFFAQQHLRLTRARAEKMQINPLAMKTFWETIGTVCVWTNDTVLWYYGMEFCEKVRETMALADCMLIDEASGQPIRHRSIIPAAVEYANSCPGFPELRDAIDFIDQQEQLKNRLP